MKRLQRLTVLFVLLSVLLAACGAAPEAPAAAEAPAADSESQTEEMGTTEDYLNASRAETVILDRTSPLQGGDNWNPYVRGSAVGWGYTEFSDVLTLLNYGSGEIENWLAESLTPNEDHSVWTLKLRPGITWHDGTPFTADDIVFSTELQMGNEALGQHFAYQEWIESVVKVDDLTVIYNLKKPNVRFKLERFSDNICGVDYFVPKHIWENVEDPATFKNFDLEKGLPMGTGPYKLAKVTQNETIWVRNDNWWAAEIGLKKLPEPKRLIMSYNGTEEVRLATAIEDDYDGLHDITYGSFQALVAQNPNWIAFQDEMPFVWPDPCARSLTVNNSIEPWNDKDMRWVLNYVMDRQQIIDIAYEGTSIMGPYPFPLYPSMQKFADLVPAETIAKFTQPNLAAAEEILIAKGYEKTGDYWSKDGEDLGLEIQVYEGISELERVADVYGEQLQRFGINAVKVNLIGGAWGDNSATGNYETQSGWQTCGSIVEPWNTLRQLRADEVPPAGEIFQLPQSNRFRWHNAEFTELVDQISELGWDDPLLFELTARALEIYYDEIPAIPTAQSKKLVPFNTTYWTNWPTIDNYYQRPVIWCPSFVGILPEITSTSQ